MKNKRANRMLKLSGIGQDIEDFGKGIVDIVMPDDKLNTNKPQENVQLDTTSAAAYNAKSEETYKQHEDEIKKILGTTADWKSPEFAQAIYNWQKNNGFTGKWIDGKFGPLTMSTMAKSDPKLKENFGAETVAPWSSDGKVKLRLTGYWPFSARPEERKMEGGVHDRMGRPLHTAEEFLAGRAPFVSLAGDYTLWPDGQELMIPWTNGQVLRGRVVDTGSHFHGPQKVYHTPGYEPIDVCVDSSQTVVPKHVEAEIVGSSPRQPPAVAQYKATQRIKYANRKARMLVLDDTE